MDTNNCHSAETQLIIDEYEKVRIDVRDTYKYTDVDPDNFKATDIKVLFFMICMEPESPSYGKATGAFIYKNEQVYQDERVYQFYYNIHTPYSKGPHLSNQMTCINRVVLNNRHGITTIKFEESCFGSMAFWIHTPMDCLTPEARSLRELMKSLQSYCRKENLCKRLRKTDKAHEKWEAIQNNIYSANNN